MTGQAGSGKTHAVQELVRACEEAGFTVLKLSHTNFCANHIKGLTVCKGLGIGMSLEVDVAKINAMARKVDILVIDEIFQSPHDHLQVLSRLREQCPNITVILVGDEKQTRAVEHAAFKRCLDPIVSELGRRLVGGLWIHFEGNHRFQRGDAINDLMRYVLDPKQQFNLQEVLTKFPAIGKEDDQDPKTTRITHTKQGSTMHHRTYERTSEKEV